MPIPYAVFRQFHASVHRVQDHQDRLEAEIQRLLVEFPEAFSSLRRAEGHLQRKFEDELISGVVYYHQMRTIVYDLKVEFQGRQHRGQLS